MTIETVPSLRKYISSAYSPSVNTYSSLPIFIDFKYGPINAINLAGFFLKNSIPETKF